MGDVDLVRLSFHEVEASAGLAGWLEDEAVSLAFTSGNQLFFVGRSGDGRVAVTEEEYGLCTALAAVGPDTLYLATRYQIWRLENALPPGDVTTDGHDRLYLPQTAWTTGLLDVHDLAVDLDGRVVFVNSRFSCLATVSETLNFEPVWVPPFVSALLPEGRCRLSGLALVDGRPAYVTSASRADTRDGWREHAPAGGVVVSVPGGEPLASGLSLPSSPVVHRGRLWITNGGSGEVGVVDPGRGTFEAVAAVPGLARGLAFHGRHAVVGSSRPRKGEPFEGLPVQERLARAGHPPRCGLFVVDVDTGRIEHSLILTGAAPDVGSVDILAGASDPRAVAFHGDDAEKWVAVPRPAARDGVI